VRKTAYFGQYLVKKQYPYKIVATQMTGIVKILADARKHFAHRIAHQNTWAQQIIENFFLFYDQDLYVIAAGHSPTHQQHMPQTAWSQATLFFCPCLATLCPATPTIACE
jgi:hypothetical protein